MPEHRIGTREEWQATRDELAKLEAEQAKRNEEITSARRALPWVRVEKQYEFDTEDGKKTLAELFHGRSQLLRSRSQARKRSSWGSHAGSSEQRKPEPPSPAAGARTNTRIDPQAGYTPTSVALKDSHTSAPSPSLRSASAAGVTSAMIGTRPSIRTRARSPYSSTPLALPCHVLRGLPSGRER